VEYKDKSSNFFLAMKKEKGQVSRHFHVTKSMSEHPSRPELRPDRAQ
jgi:hypothetical protein